MGWGSRLPNSNDPPPVGKSPYGSSSELVDDIALLLSGDGARCNDCQQVIYKVFLENGQCPDCYEKKHGVESPALARERAASARRYGGCASGEDGEAD